ncbi:hypothetical protein I8H83_02570 [Candidatus Saccharibacteria bacterium]|nr:hypothetical protein [Candidatus Saccharibacteria bacterium]
MYSFESNQVASEFVRSRVDVPAVTRSELIGNDMRLEVASYDLGGGKFTNSYDISFLSESGQPNIEISQGLASVFERAREDPSLRVVTGAGFFFLVDQVNAVPRQYALNLALQDGQLHSFPVADRESVFVEKGRMSYERIEALGALSLNGVELSWSGALSEHDTDVRVFSNGSSVITHVRNDETGSMRVLDDSSRYTPEIDDDYVDVGLIRREDGVFVGVTTSASGGVDILTHDVVLRAHERYIHGEIPDMRVHTVGRIALDGAVQGAISVGPMLDEKNFSLHSINNDKSLGSRPPFLEVPLARTVVYDTDDGHTHIRLFDGRPGSPIFPGVTPQQAVDLIGGKEVIATGCFLDPGQTAKLAVKETDEVMSYGNTHYLQWPQLPGEKFVWTPQHGRQVASMITLR